MHLDSWILIAAWQLLLASWVAAGYLWWRGRAVPAQVAKAAEQCAAAEAALDTGKKLLAAERSKDSWQEHLKERLKTLKAASPAADSPEAHALSVHKLVIEHELGGATGCIDAAALPGSGTVAQPPVTDATNAELTTLRAEKDGLAKKLAELTSRSATEAASDRERELKSLVQQFTHDSREMLSCIQKLESENTELRQQLRQFSKDAA